MRFYKAQSLKLTKHKSIFKFNLACAKHVIRPQSISVDHLRLVFFVNILFIKCTLKLNDHILIVFIKRAENQLLNKMLCFSASMGDFVVYRKIWLKITKNNPIENVNINQIKSAAVIDLSFKKLITGKKIFIAAPGESISNVHQKNYDIIIVLNKLYQDGIVYLNKDMVEFYKSNGELKKFISCGGVIRVDYRIGLEDKYSFVDVVKPVLGNLNLLPKVILDLWTNDAGAISISSDFDMMLTPERPKGYVPSNTKLDKKTKDRKLRFLQSTILNHDPLSQFYLLSFLYKNKIFDVIGDGRNVFGISDIDYVKELTIKYSH